MSIYKINPYVVGYLEFAYSSYQEELPEERFLWDEYWNDQLLFDALIMRVYFGKELILLGKFIFFE
jgi:hypothetical protein